MKTPIFLLSLLVGVATGQVRNNFNQHAQPYRPPPPPPPRPVQLTPKPRPQITPRFNEAANPRGPTSGINPPSLKYNPPKPPVGRNFTGFGGVPKFGPGPKVNLSSSQRQQIKSKLSTKFKNAANGIKITPPGGVQRRFSDPPFDPDKLTPKFNRAASKVSLPPSRQARLKSLLTRMRFNAKASGATAKDAFTIASTKAHPPSSVKDEGYGYKALWKDHPNDRVFFTHSEERISITSIKREGNPKGSAGSMIAEALRAANITKPKRVRFESIMPEQPTTQQLKQGMPPEKTTLGKTLESSLRHLGGKPGRWSTGEYRGKLWLECEPVWK